MKEVKLSNSDEVALVDDDIFFIINAYRWYLSERFGSKYARCTDRDGIYMHSMVMGTRSPIDHKDHNGLNNQRNNLRLTDASSNQHNRKKQGRGVSKLPNGIWVAYAHRQGRRIYLGKHKTEQEALDAKATFDKNSI